MSERSAPRIGDVARVAGVSPMTVSRTLAGTGTVAPATQERVWAAVRELGYHRNENARSLRPGQPSGLIGVAVTNFANPYYGSLAVGVEELVAAQGKRILLASTGEDPSREEQVIADFAGRQVDGIVLVPSTDAAEAVRVTAASGIPLVLASRGAPDSDVDSVVLDDGGGAQRATEMLLAAGHTRIAFLGNQASVWTGRRRLEGFLAAHEAAGVTVDDALVRQGQQASADVHAVVRSLLALPDPPTAYFAANNRNTVGLLQELASSGGGRMPQIAAFDALELQELLPVDLTVVTHDPAALGRAAAELLLARLGDPDRPTRRVEVPVGVQRVRRAPAP